MDSSQSQSRLFLILPGVAAATAFAVTDVLGKVVIVDGTDVLTLSTFRGLVSVALMYAWLRIDAPATPYTPKQRWIALGIGVLFAGVVYALFKAIEAVEVSIAILSYFIYPLLTGIVGALLGMEKLTWRGAIAAVVAFLGLALTLGASPGGVALAGVTFAFVAACFRVAVLLLTRGLLRDADARLVTWYSMLSSTAIFAAASLGTWTWNGPQSGVGWVSLVVLSVATVIAVFALFVSIRRIGPFRSALIMNLEPLLATILSVPLLGEVMSPLQALGGAVMLGALVAFQIRR